MPERREGGSDGNGLRHWRSGKDYRDARESRPVEEEFRMDAVMIGPF
jgi:hypothetical protein